MVFMYVEILNSCLNVLERKIKQDDMDLNNNKETEALTTQTFNVSWEIILVFGTMIIFNIQNNKFFFMNMLFTIAHIVNAYYQFNYLLTNVLYILIFMQFGSYIFGYIWIQNSKTNFVLQKQNKRMTREQYSIVRNLPDGALIYR